LIWMGEKDTDKTPEPDAHMASDDSHNRVEHVNNKIYFYSEVTRPKILALNKKLVSLNTSILNQTNTLDLTESQTRIKVHINSFGGSVFAAFAAVDYIKKMEVPVVSIVDGCAASAATMMSIVAPERYMHENSFMLIHQLSSASWGKYEELKDSMTNNDLLMETIKNLYIKYTKIPKKKLEDILKHDLWWGAKTCLEYGLIDDII